MLERPEPYDILWILICAALVFLMQAGFTCLESGIVRTKNSINVALKNFTDFLIAAGLFWVLGFGFMFGVSYAGWIGTTDFFFGGHGDPWLLAFFLFQLVFCGIAITLRTRANGDWVEIHVKDRGTGIPEPIPHKIFDPLFTTKKVGKGTGQGLAIVHDVVVRKHGRTAEVETAEGVGTTCLIRQPLGAPYVNAERRR